MSSRTVWGPGTVEVNDNYPLLYEHSFFSLPQSAALTTRPVCSSTRLHINTKFTCRYLAVLASHNTNFTTLILQHYLQH